jgi:hypothetical protein
LRSALLKLVAVTFLQATKTKLERTQNIKGAFEFNRPGWIAGKMFQWWMMYLQQGQR